MKNSFKDIAQDFGKSKQQRLDGDKVTATNLLIKAERDLLAGDDSAKIRIEFLESQLQTMNLKQKEAVKICSRAQWLEEGEKQTKYFFTHESTRAEKNAIRVMYDSQGNEVVAQQENQPTLIFIENYIHEILCVFEFKVIFCPKLMFL